MEKIQEALANAYFVAVSELPAHHPVCQGIAKLLPKTGMANVAHFLSRMQSKVAETQKEQETTIGPDARFNGEGRMLVKWVPGSNIKKKTEGLRKPPASGSVSIQDEEEPSRQQKVRQAISPIHPPAAGKEAEGDDEENPVVITTQAIPLQSLSKKTASAIEAEFSREQIIATLVSVGVTEPNLEQSTRQLCAQLVKNLPK